MTAALKIGDEGVWVMIRGANESDRDSRLPTWFYTSTGCRCFKNGNVRIYEDDRVVARITGEAYSEVLQLAVDLGAAYLEQGYVYRDEEHLGCHNWPNCEDYGCGG